MILLGDHTKPAGTPRESQGTWLCLASESIQTDGTVRAPSLSHSGAGDDAMLDDSFFKLAATQAAAKADLPEEGLEETSRRADFCRVSATAVGHRPFYDGTMHLFCL